MTIDRPNLANAFAPAKPAPADRAEGLRGLLPPTRPKRDLAPKAEPEIELVDTPAAGEKRRSAPEAARKRPTQTATNADVDKVSSVACYIEPDILALARAEVRRTGSTYDQLLVDAFDTVTDDQLQRHFAPINQERAERGMPARARRVRGTAGIQVQFRMDHQQRNWLEDKATAVQAPSRSALVAAALRLHLTAQ